MITVASEIMADVPVDLIAGRLDQCALVVLLAREARCEATTHAQVCRSRLAGRQLDPIALLLMIGFIE